MMGRAGRNVWTDSKAAWVKIDSGASQFPETGGGGPDAVVRRLDASLDDDVIVAHFRVHTTKPRAALKVVGHRLQVAQAMTRLLEASLGRIGKICRSPRLVAVTADQDCAREYRSIL